MPAPGILGVAAAAAATGLAAAAGRAAASSAAAAAFLLLAGWLVLYLRISAPINRTFTSAADAHVTAADARTLQRDWDRIIVPRAVLQGLTVVAPCVSLIG
jgi:hypothetical protein